MHRIFTKLQAIHQVAAVKMMKIMCTFDGRFHKQARWPVVRPPQSAPAPASDVLNNHESLPKRNLWGLLVQDVLQARCPACQPTNSVKALKAIQISLNDADEWCELLKYKLWKTYSRAGLCCNTRWLCSWTMDGRAGDLSGYSTWCRHSRWSRRVDRFLLNSDWMTAEVFAMVAGGISYVANLTVCVSMRRRPSVS